MTRDANRATTAETLSRTPSHVVKARLAKVGYPTFSGVAEKIGGSRSLVSAVVRKKSKSKRVWRELAKLLRNGGGK